MNGIRSRSFKSTIGTPALKFSKIHTEFGRKLT